MVLNGKNIQSCHDFLNATEAKLLAASEDGQGLEGLSDLFTGLLAQIQIKCLAVGETNRELQQIEGAQASPRSATGVMMTGIS